MPFEVARPAISGAYNLAASTLKRTLAFLKVAAHKARNRGPEH